jgi:autotransporter-associated beta strand protein
MKNQSFKMFCLPQIGVLAVLLAGLVVVQQAGATTYTWNVSSGNWGTAGSWTPGGPPGSGDTATFGATGVSGSSSTVGNVVDSTFGGTITALNYTQTGSSSYQVTQISSPQSLTVSGAITVGGQTGNSDVTPTYMTGTGALVSSGASASITVQNYGSSSSSGVLATFNLANLSYFVYSNSSGTISVASGTTTYEGGVMYLAGVSNSITAGTIAVSAGNEANSGNSSSGLYLGNGTNNINVGTLDIGMYKSAATVQFQSGAPGTAGVRIRNTDGASAVTTIALGDQNAKTGTSSPVGTLNLTGGYGVDIKAGTLLLGRANASSGSGTPTPAGTASFDSGTINASTINMAVNSQPDASTSVSGKLNVNANTTAGTFGTLIVGSGGLSLVNLTGTGTAAGTLSIAGGTVTCNGSITKATSSGTATIYLGGTLQMASGCTIGAGNAIDNLVISNNVTFQYSVPNSGAEAVVSALTWPASDSTLTINVSSLPGSAAAGSTYPLFQYTTFSGTFNANAQTVNLPANYTGHLTQAGGAINLVIDTAPESLNWAGKTSGGASDGNWNKSDVNWLNGATYTTYADADQVMFGDVSSPATSTVSLPGTVSPGSITVNNTASTYSISGGGAISGASDSLTKSGTGTLTMSESGGDSFAGGITVNNGTLNLEDTGVSLGGGLSVSGGSILLDESGTFSGNTTIAASTTVQVGNSDANGVLPSGAVSDSGTLTFDQINSSTVNNTISGSGTVNQNGTGTLALGGVNSSFTGGININSGILQAANTNALGSWTAGAVTISSGGTLDLGGISSTVGNSTSHALFGTKQFNISGAGVGNNGAIINSGANNTELDGGISRITLTGNATLGGSTRWDMRNNTPTLNLAGFTLTKTGANEISLAGSPTIQMGTGGSIIINQGELAIEGTPVFSGSGNSITVNSGTTLGNYELASGSFTCPITLNGGTLLNSSGNGNTSCINDAPITLDANSTLDSGGNTGNTITINGVISGGGYGLTISGIASDAAIFTAAETYSGNTTINSTLVLSGSGSIADSPNITIASGATFNVSAVGMTMGASQTLDVSATGGNTTATLTTASGDNLTLSAGGLAFTAYAGGATAPLTVSGTSAGTLALNGAPVTVTTTATLAVGAYELIAAGGSATVTGTPGTLTVNGDGAASGAVPFLQVVSGSLWLYVPGISASSTLSAAITSTYGTPANPASVSVSGANLSGNVTATAQSGYQVATSSGGPYSSSVTLTESGGTLSATPVYVEFTSAEAAGNYNNATAVALTGGGAATVNVATTSSGNTVNPATPTVMPVWAGGTSFAYSGAAQGPMLTSVTTSPQSTGTTNVSYLGVGGTTYATNANAPTNAGNYSVTVTIGPDANNNSSSASENFSINPLAVQLSGGKTYDGSATVSYSILSIGNVASGDTVSLNGGSATLASANAGSENITANTLTLTGSSSANYTTTGAGGTVTINPLSVVLTGTRAYDGTSNAVASILSVANAIGSDNVDVASGTASLSAASAGTQGITSLGTLALGNNTAGDYTLTGASGTVLITAQPGVVYDDTENQLDYILSFTNGQEIGDQIYLQDNQTYPYLTNFSLEYYSTNAAFYGAVTADVRFYLNDGPPTNGYNTPSNIFYDTGWFVVKTPQTYYPGTNSVVLDFLPADLVGGVVPLDPSMAMPSNFTVSVTFQGLAGSALLGYDTVGLDDFDPPAVGTNYGDYWFNNEGTWELLTNTAPVAFSMEFIDSSEPGAPLLYVSSGPTQATVWWSPYISGWTLQTNNVLNNSGWGNYQGTINNNSATISSPQGDVFFRLYQP